MRLFRALIETFTSEQIDLPRWCTPGLEHTRRRLAAQVRDILTAIVKDKFAEQQQQRSHHNSGSSSPPQSILAMSLQGMVDGGSLSSDDDTLAVTCDQLSSFLFAGHDTTGTTVAWVLYELYRTPRALRAVRAEVDGLFGVGTGAEGVVARLRGPGGEGLVRRMVYTSAVIRETL